MRLIHLSFSFYSENLLLLYYDYGYDYDYDHDHGYDLCEKM